MRSRIRKSADHRIFAPARSLSQLVTSFFGSWCQGIRLVLFVTWPLACLWSENPAQSSCYSLFKRQTFFKYPHQRLCVGFFTTVLLVVKIFWFSRLINEIVFWDLSQNPQNFEKTLLWFISISFSLLTCLYTIWYFIQFSRYILESSARLVVENKGFEPLTPCVQGRCSPSWANSPYACLF